jgi:type IV pilus biogenesis protein CpaD/CtpE
MLLAAALLAGCTPNDTSFGGALKTNVALQVINPDPVPTGTAQAGGSGEQAGRAAEHYRKGTVKPLSVQTTSGIGGGSGGSGGGGSSAGSGVR